MTDIKTLLRIGALASVLSALTTAILMYGPNAAPAPDFEARQMLMHDPLHLYKKWILFLHPQFALIAAFAAGAILWQQSRTWVILGCFYLGVWAITEMAQQAYLIDALNQIWRPAYFAAEGADKEAWRTLILGSGGVSDSQYFIIIFGFGVGSLCFGLAFCPGTGTERILGAAISMIGVLSLLAFLRYYAGAAWAGPIVSGWYEWIYGPLQISVRVALGIWLWRQLSSPEENKV